MTNGFADLQKVLELLHDDGVWVSKQSNSRELESRLCERGEE